MDPGTSLTTGAIPDPDSPTLGEMGDPASFTVSCALLPFTAEGVKITEIVQVLLAESDAGQFVVLEKSAGFVYACNHG